jgi:hypothetical protein
MLGVRVPELPGVPDMGVVVDHPPAGWVGFWAGWPETTPLRPERVMAKTIGWNLDLDFTWDIPS